MTDEIPTAPDPAPPHAASLWQLTGPRITSDAFTPDPRDAVVVGAGLTGLVTAVLLARAGQRVAVLEARTAGAVTTGNTTGKLSLLQGTTFSEILEHSGQEALEAYAQANREGQAWLLRQLESWGVEVPLRRAFTYATEPAQLETLRRERDAAAGVGVALEEAVDPLLPCETAGAISLADQAQLQPMTVLAQLARELRERGGVLIERCRVREVEEVGDGLEVVSDLGAIRAGICVLATGTPILDRGLFFAKLQPARSFVAAYRLGAAAAPRGMYVSVGSPARSLRTAEDTGGRELLVVGGGRVPGRGDGRGGWDELDDWTLERFGPAQRIAGWAAQDYRTHSRLPFAGAMQRGGGRIFAATGYNKWGMTNGVAAALTIAADVLGGNLEWARAMREHAVRAPAVVDAIETNLRVAGRAVGGWVGAELGPAKDAADLSEGEGTVAREGLAPVGVARVDGRICRVSAVCPHLGGILAWNRAERSWDCPLHGSRFTADGERLEGPAVDDLGVPGE